VAVDVTRPERSNWREVLAEADDPISDVGIVDHKLVVTYFHDAYHQIKYFDMDGRPLGEIPLPTLGTAVPLSGGPNDQRLYFSFASFLYPDTIFCFDFERKPSLPLPMTRA
jgi:prolyl oligopeptidase